MHVVDGIFGCCMHWRLFLFLFFSCRISFTSILLRLLYPGSFYHSPGKKFSLCREMNVFGGFRLYIVNGNMCQYVCCALLGNVLAAEKLKNATNLSTRRLLFEYSCACGSMRIWRSCRMFTVRVRGLEWSAEPSLFLRESPRIYKQLRRRRWCFT